MLWRFLPPLRKTLLHSWHWPRSCTTIAHSTSTLIDIAELYEESWSMTVRDYESLQYMIQSILDTQVVKYDSGTFLGTNFFNTWNEYNQKILSGESPASVIASFKDAAQAQLDSILLLQ